MLTCVLLHPFCFFGLDSNTALVALEGKRVKFVNPTARAGGIAEGMLETAARLKLEGAQFVASVSVEGFERWKALLEQFYALSPCVQDAREGIAFLTLRESDALLLAQNYGARVARAPTQELALLAAQLTGVGEVFMVPFERGKDLLEERKAFLERCPIAALALLGMEGRTLERLSLLGLHSIGALYGWSKPQLGGFFGREAKMLLSVLYEGTARVARYIPHASVTAHHTPFETLSEPYQLEPLLERLAHTLHTRLEGKQARRLILLCSTPLGQLSEIVHLKSRLCDVWTLNTALRAALERCGAAPLGVSKLEATLTELCWPGEQKGLFEVRPSALEAVELVHRKFPGAIVQAALRDRFTQARDLAFEFRPWMEGVNRASAPRGR